MRRLIRLVGIAIFSGGLCACASSQGDLSAIPQKAGFAAISNPLEQSAGMIAGHDAKPPSGFVAFCDRNPGECRTHRGQPGQIAFTDEAWETLQKVNIVVNNAIRPVDDSDHYAINEFWTIPVDGEGDCEDYVLAKRKMLTLLGLPEPALRITVALNRASVRHAVLTVVTDHGDYVLDNLQDDILPPEKIGYKWVERQDPASRTGWMAMK